MPKCILCIYWRREITCTPPSRLTILNTNSVCKALMLRLHQKQSKFFMQVDDEVNAPTQMVANHENLQLAARMTRMMQSKKLASSTVK